MTKILILINHMKIENSLQLCMFNITFRLSRLDYLEQKRATKYCTCRKKSSLISFCTDNNFLVSGPSYLDKFLAWNNGNSWMCILCKKSFTVKGNAHRHLKALHGNNEKKQCITCAKWLKNDLTLKRHIFRFHRELAEFMEAK